ncbi:hypothetical protein LCGC14_2776380, partial [marine sediment metagenome]
DKLGSGIGYSKWKNIAGRTYNRFMINISKKCKGVTAVSEQTKKDLTTYLDIPEEKIKVIRSGIRLDLIPMKKKDKTFRVGYLGALDRRKRVGLLIGAFKASELGELAIGGSGLDESILKGLAEGDKRIKFLGRHDNETQLLIAGTGVDEQKLRALAQGDDRITFEGRIPDDKLVDFYNSLDVFIFPTWVEGYGLPIVEAMACKKPVIVLFDASIPWDIKKRCVIVDRLDYVLANQTYLTRLCKSVNIEDNYRWAKEHDWDKTVDEYIKIYEEILS